MAGERYAAPFRYAQEMAPESRSFFVNRVHKFGGTSMEQTGQVTDIIDSVRRNGGSDIVVVSALAGVTNNLLAIEKDIGLHNNGANYTDILTKVVVLPHRQKAHEIGLTDEEFARYDDELGTLSVDLLYEMDKGFHANRDTIISFGEKFSSRLLAASLRSQGVPAQAVDTDFIYTSPTLPGYIDDPDILWNQTHRETQRALHGLLSQGVIPILTGYTGRRPDGIPTTLGRGGSDYTASVLARIMGARTVNIWTDVDGVYTGNPKTDTTAAYLPEITHEQADRMAKDGHKVLNPRTMEPLLGTRAVLVVRNTFNPQNPGTRIVPA